LKAKRKKSGEASEDVAVVSRFASGTGHLQRGKMVGVGLSLQAKREVLAQVGPQYRSASAAQKKLLLDAFVCTTGYHRKYAMWLLNHSEAGQSAPARPRPCQYGAEVQEALVLAWEKMKKNCDKPSKPSQRMRRCLHCPSLTSS
jgi:hypothetical protein